MLGYILRFTLESGPFLIYVIHLSYTYTYIYSNRVCAYDLTKIKAASANKLTATLMW